jgi:hypothetical protein
MSAAIEFCIYVAALAVAMAIGLVAVYGYPVRREHTSSYRLARL